MTRSVWRLLVICTAWAAGAAVVWAMGAYTLDTVVPALFAAAAYTLTRAEDVRRGGPPKYWRGRRL